MPGAIAFEEMVEMVVCDKSEVVVIWRQPEVSIDLTVGSINLTVGSGLMPRIEKVSYGCILPRS